MDPWKYIERKSREVSKEEQSVLCRWVEWLLSQNLHPNRVYKYLYTIVSLKRKLQWNLVNIQKKDIVQFTIWVNSQRISKWTKRDYVIVFKKFLEFSGHTEEAKRLRNIKIYFNERVRKEILTEEEIKKILEVIDNIRDKCIICLLYELGLRPHELINLRISDLEIYDKFTLVLVRGKTGERRLISIICHPYLISYLNSITHPHEFLFVNNRGNKLSYENLRQLVKKWVKKAGVNKRVPPYTFRHSGATHLARVLTEQELKAFFGWSMDSDMPKIYVHLSGKDVAEKLLELYGLKAKEQKERLKLKAKVCKICGKVNGIDANFCSNCGARLED